MRATREKEKNVGSNTLLDTAQTRFGRGRREVKRLLSLIQRMRERAIARILIYGEKLLETKIKRIIRTPSRERIISIFACHGQVSLHKLATER